LFYIVESFSIIKIILFDEDSSSEELKVR